MELELPSRPSSIPTPTSPAHRVDVPHGIESGTDTEAESEDLRVTQEPESMDELPPALPPKDLRKGNTRPPQLRLDTLDISNNGLDAGHPDSEGASESPESSPVERTSHATFIAPALPPIRISMGGTDFSDLLKSVGGDVFKLDQLAETTEDGSLKLDLTLTSPPILVSQRSSVQMLTPRSDVTVTDTSDGHNSTRNHPEAADMHRDSLHGRVLSRDNIPNPSVSPAAPLVNSDNLSEIPTIPMGRRVSMDSNSESSHLSEDHCPNAGSSVTRSAPYAESETPNARPSLDARSSRRGSLSSSGHDALTGSREATRITVTSPDSASASAELFRPDTVSLVKQRLQNVMSTAAECGATHVTVELDVMETVIKLLDQQKEECSDLKHRFEGIKVNFANMLKAEQYDLLLPPDLHIEGQSALHGWIDRGTD